MDGAVPVSDSDGVAVGDSESVGVSLGVSDSVGGVVCGFVGFLVAEGLPCVGESLGLPLDEVPVPGLVPGPVVPGDGVPLVDGVAVPVGPGDPDPSDVPPPVAGSSVGSSAVRPFSLSSSFAGCSVVTFRPSGSSLPEVAPSVTTVPSTAASSAPAPTATRLRLAPRSTAVRPPRAPAPFAAAGGP